MPELSQSALAARDIFTTSWMSTDVTHHKSAHARLNRIIFLSVGHEDKPMLGKKKEKIHTILNSD